MKMVLGSGTISNYASFVYNCTLNQYKYKIPVNSLQDVQLYIDIGLSAPGSLTIELIHTCGLTGGTIETLTTSDYVVGQDAFGNYYGVFRNFNESTTATCFVIAITLDSQIYFSQEYCVEANCSTGLTLIKGCYGNLEPMISYDREKIYFGKSQGGTTGNSNIVYEHYALIRKVEININAVKNTFKKGRTRNFRTESEDIYLFWAEWIPGWYLRHIDAIFKRGEVFIGDIKYLLESTDYELLDDCLRTWRPSVNLLESQFQSFSCEPDPCTIIEGSGVITPGACCDPTVINASVVFVEGNTVTVNFTTCSPAPANGYVVIWRVAGSGSSFTNAGTFGTSPAVFFVGGTDGQQYEGYIYSDCGSGIVGNFIPWATVGASTYTIRLLSPCVGTQDSNFIIENATPGDTITVRATFNGMLQKLGGLFTRADLGMTLPGAPIASSACYTDTSIHTFSIFTESTFVIGATTQTFTTQAVVNNGSASPTNLTIEITNINGVPQSGISASGCTGNSATGGTC